MPDRDCFVIINALLKTISKIIKFIIGLPYKYRVIDRLFSNIRLTDFSNGVFK